MLYPYYVALWGTFGGMSFPLRLRVSVGVTADDTSSVFRNDVYDVSPRPGTRAFLAAVKNFFGHRSHFLIRVFASSSLVGGGVLMRDVGT